ncbi:M56 family metallopeptidase [Clostridium hydrogenum]|uniref:M56 family metallopeptidase n=1 Tax=Clostridium hydrogenum TaxID=2855764 RepID=UPI001F1E4B4E|nr:M56 family metallopeptidase [Clostridium hydrogenum]
MNYICNQGGELINLICISCEDIFETVFLSSVIGSCIVLLILANKILFKNKLNSTFHYYIWLILIIKLLLPLGPHYSFNIFNALTKFNVQNTSTENTKKIPIKSSSQPKNAPMNYSSTINNIHSQNKILVNTNASIPLKKQINIRKNLYLVWIFGMLLFIGILALGYKKLQKIIRFSDKNINFSHNKILSKCTNDMNIKTKLQLLYSSEISTPSLCGILKPKILIPIKAVGNISDKEFKYIILHELSHLKSKDIFINWIITILFIVYWFNPILLYGLNKMRQDCEISCDYQVISHLAKDENVQYGNTILKILELGGGSRRLTGTTPMLTNNSEIKRRIIMISKYKKISSKSILLGGIIITIIAGVSSLVNIPSTSLHQNIINVAKAQTNVKKPYISSPSHVNLLADINALKTNDTSSITPFSSDIVIYDSHPDENYPAASGINVCQIGALINNKLVKEGLNSNFIKCTAPKEYSASFKNSRDIITKNVKNYNKTILLDIHRDTDITNANSNTITFILTRKCPYYKENLKFVNKIIASIKHSSQVKTRIFYYDYGIGYYNQDLSNKSVLIEIGTDHSTNKNIEDCIDALIPALNQSRE